MKTPSTPDMQKLEEAMKAMKQMQELGNMAAKPEPEGQVIQLDEDDLLRAENISLHRRVEELTQQLEEFRRNYNAEFLEKKNDKLLMYLAEKYKIDTEKFNASLDAQNKTLTLSSKNVDADN